MAIRVQKSRGTSSGVRIIDSRCQWTKRCFTIRGRKTIGAGQYLAICRVAHIYYLLAAMPMATSQQETRTTARDGNIRRNLSTKV